MVFVKDMSDRNLWRIAGPKGNRSERARKLIASTRNEYMADVSPDGKGIVYDQEDVTGSDLILVENFR